MTRRYHCTFSLLAMLKLLAWNGDKARNKPVRRASEVRRLATMMSELVDPSSCRDGLRPALGLYMLARGALHTTACRFPKRPGIPRDIFFSTSPPRSMSSLNLSGVRPEEQGAQVRGVGVIQCIKFIKWSKSIRPAWAVLRLL